MKLVIQRVRSANVTVDGKEVARIGQGALILVGVARGDSQIDVRYLARKTSQLRIYDDEAGRLNNAINEIKGSFLVVSQFTLYADCSKGNRPGYTDAAEPAEAERLYEEYVRELRILGHEAQTGLFGAKMVVRLANDGPVTIIMESCGRTTP